MARYEHLPIYRDALAFAVHIEQVVAGFSRYHKYTLGTELRQTSRHSVQLIMRVNSQTDKRAGLLALREHLESVLLLLRIAKEAKAFKSFKAYCFCAEQLAKVCKQCEGWLKSLSPQAQALA